MADVLDSVGWVQEIIVNKTTGHLVDGHLRVELARQRGETEIPVKYVELEPWEENLILASLDPIAGLARRNSERFDELLATIPRGDAVVSDLV